MLGCHGGGPAVLRGPSDQHQLREPSDSLWTDSAGSPYLGIALDGDALAGALYPAAMDPLRTTGGREGKLRGVCPFVVWPGCGAMRDSPPPLWPRGVKDSARAVKRCSLDCSPLDSDAIERCSRSRSRSPADSGAAGVCALVVHSVWPLQSFRGFSLPGRASSRCFPP